MTETTPVDAAAAIEQAGREIARATEIALAASTSSEMVIGRDDAQATKLRLAGSHSQIARAHKTALAAHDAAKAVLEAQRRELEARLRAMQLELQPMLDLAARLQDGIGAVNLYLGRDEDLRELRDGESAPAGTPLHIRQQVLAMDEETALLATSGGLDFQNIDVFVDWLLEDEGNLDQILPEQRGVVALMARSTPVDYTGNAMINAALNKKNFESWFLIKNGQRLYLMTTDFSVGKRLIPERDEFTSMFLTSDGAGGKRSLEPGSHAWLNAEKVADVKTRHYMKVALILQGLVDRTAVFHPLPATGLNLLGQDDYDSGAVVLIADNELAIGTGRPSFLDWQQERLARLDVGHRVIGHFGSTFGRDEIRRITPENASGPARNVVHTIDRKDKNYFTFVYDRTDTVYRPGFRSGTAKTRASYRIDRKPWGRQSYIPVDDVTVEEMRYYLGSRSERHAYKEIFPALQAAIAFKESEDAAEAPFRALLAAALSSEGLDDTNAMDQTRELISWWKTANKWHRALNGDPAWEARAQRGILGEARRRLANTGDAPEQLSASVAAVAPDAMVVARRSTDFVAVEAQPRRYGAGSVPQNVFVRVHEFTGAGKHRKSTEWKTLTHAQVARWTVLEQTDEWDGWAFNVPARKHLVDDEIGAVVAEARARAGKAGTASVVKYGELEERVGIEIAWSSRFEARRTPLGGTPEGGLGKLVQPYVGAVVTIGADGVGTVTGHLQPQNRDWDVAWAHRGDPDTARSPHTTRAFGLKPDTIVWTDDAALADDSELAVVWLADLAARREASEQVRLLTMQIEKAWTVAEEAGRRARFLEDFGDDTLWEDHSKSQKVAPFPIARGFHSTNVLEAMIARLVKAGTAVAGITIGEALALDDNDGAGFPTEVIGLRFAVDPKKNG